MEFSTLSTNMMFCNADDAGVKVTAFKFTRKNGYEIGYAPRAALIEPTFDFADSYLQELLDGTIVECHTTNTTLTFVTNVPATVLDAWKDLGNVQDDFAKPYKLTQINSHTFVLS